MATIVIEHLIQASDVAHTMQHWYVVSFDSIASNRVFQHFSLSFDTHRHVYKKWNERLFKELYDAYQSGRWDKDPSENWYQGEIGFFDNYIIPLAKKLKECGVFGVSSDEYLNYAYVKTNRQEVDGCLDEFVLIFVAFLNVCRCRRTENRNEWKAKGQEVVADYLRKYRKRDEEPVGLVL